ncbi:MAG: HAD family phosphatase [Spirochaetes bacterium]|nr:MAG: HAD family phosphatase [Spirochaetota bacterium]
MRKLYIFDMGGVVSRNTNVIPLIAEHLNMDERSIHAIAGGDFRELMTGNISVEEFWKRFCWRTGRKVEKDLLEHFFHPTPDQKVRELVERIKSFARVVVGTNTIEPHYRIHLKNGDYDVFDAVYASHLMGLAKPDASFYTHILEREGCLPDAAVFIDDMKVNVEAARKLGIEAYLFEGAERLARDLGVEIEKF